MESFREIDKYLRDHLSEKRYYHSHCVAEQGEFLGKQRGIDPEKARLAGLIHDICKNLSESELLQYLKSRDILLGNAVLANPSVLHGIVGSYFIKEQFGIINEEIRGAVYYHTIGKARMSPLEEVIYIADLTSKDRQYGDVEKMRKYAVDDWDRALLEGFVFGIKSSLKKRTPLIRETVEGYNYYLTLQEGQLYESQ